MRKLLFFFFFLLVSRVWAISIELPPVSGWAASEPDFLVYSNGQTKAFYLRRLYQNENGATIEVLLAGGLEGKRLEQALKGRFELETESYYLRYTQEGDYKVFATYHRPEKRGVYAVFLSTEPVLVLMARYQGLTDSEAISWLKRLDWNDLTEKALSLLGKRGNP